MPRYTKIALVLLLMIPCANHSDEKKELVKIEAKQLLYSYDRDMIFARDNVKATFAELKVTAKSLRLLFNSGKVQLTGNVVLSIKDEVVRQADEMIITLQDLSYEMYDFKEAIKIETSQKEGPEKKIPMQADLFEAAYLKNIKSSFLYFQADELVIYSDLSVEGKNLLAYLEGEAGAYFEDLKIRGATKGERTGLSMNNLSLSSSQGLILGIGYDFRLGEGFRSSTSATYEERSWIENILGPERIFRFNTNNSLALFDNDAKLDLSGKYDTTEIWNLRALYSHRIAMGHDISGELYYYHPKFSAEELWYRLRGNHNFQSLGSLNYEVAYEQTGWLNTSMSYSKNLLESISLNANVNYNRKESSDSSYMESRLLAGNINIGYNSSLFVANFGYSLNRDYLNETTFAQPGLSISLTPFRFYDDLLELSISNSMMYSSFREQEMDERINFSNNSMLSLRTVPFSVIPGSRIMIDFRMEQMFLRNDDPVSQIGFMLNYMQKLAGESSLHLVLNFSSRRLSDNWFIEGTNTIKLLMELNYNLLDTFKGSVSTTYDLEASQFYTANAFLNIDLGKRWSVVSSLSYDFIMDRVNDINIMLSKDIIRAEIKFRWRKSTNSFMLEFTPR